MRVAIRTGGGRQTGFGHVRRCLSLASALRSLGADTMFLLDGDDEVFEPVAAAGFETRRVEPVEAEPATLEEIRAYQPPVVVVDSYRVREAAFQAFASTGAAVVAIDDVGNRELPVDLVINGSAGAERLPYREAERTRYLLGPDYVLLRHEFAEEPRRSIAHEVQRVLITFGGSDPHGLTPKVSRWAAEALGETVHLDVVIGPLFADTLTDGGNPWPTRTALHRAPKEIRGLMLVADLAICGGGQTTYELAATGTPAIGMRVADNQTQNLRGLTAAGVLTWIGDVHHPDLESRVKEAVLTLARDQEGRDRMSWRGRALVDGQGAVRVAQAIMTLGGEAR